MSEIVLEYRAHFLYTLLKMYHCDINAIYEQCKCDEQDTRFVDKMYSIMESYLPLLQYNGNIFQNVSSLKLPKVSAFIDFYSCKNNRSEYIQLAVGESGANPPFSSHVHVEVV